MEEEGFEVRAFSPSARRGKGRVKLAVTGFGDPRSLVSASEVVEALSLLPGKHLHGLKTIKYDPDRTVHTALSWAGEESMEPGVMGHFMRGYVEGICLYEMRSRDSFFWLLLHEIGHHVYYNILPPSYRDGWQDAWRAGGFVSSRARCNVFEDFAESYAAFLLAPERLQRIAPQKTRYMRECIFGPFYE